MKKVSIGKIRARQVGLVALLAICAGQVGWWMLDQVHDTALVRDEMVGLYAADAQAAEVLWAAGVTRERILTLYPHLTSDEGGRLVINPEVLQELSSRRYHRLNRYGWEGGFFLLVLLAAMWILARALRQEGELRQRQENFVAAVSHELKSPLASMKLSAETMSFRNPPEERRRELVKRILQDIDRLESMVSNILDASRLGTGRIQVVSEPLMLAEAVWKSVEELRERAALNQAVIDWEVDEDLEIVADRVAVRTVLRNLLDNGIKAVNAAGGGTITIRAALEGAFIRVDIVDTGVGFPPGESERLFEKFYRPGNELQRKSPGSGLGLYIVLRFVQLGGGRVEAYSEGSGQGARFQVWWPKAEKQI